MGCDIHDYVEVKNDNEWQMLGHVFKDHYNKDRLSEHPYDSRNYRLFGLLAGVRNQEIVPIDKRRGIPPDASEGYKAVIERWMGDGHSHSYFTLNELVSYPLYKESIKVSGIVCENQYKKFLEQGYPNNWSSGYSGPMVFKISIEEMNQCYADRDAFIQSNIAQLLFERKRLAESYKCFGPNHTLIEIEHWIEAFNNNIYPKGDEIRFCTEIEWQEVVSDYIGSSWFDTLEQMKAFAPNGDYDRIRMVFFFDN